MALELTYKEWKLEFNKGSRQTPRLWRVSGREKGQIHIR